MGSGFLLVASVATRHPADRGSVCVAQRRGSSPDDRLGSRSRRLGVLVLDELHTYRGRHGADVAMLLRRVRERAGNPRLLHIGTSATMYCCVRGRPTSRRANTKGSRPTRAQEARRSWLPSDRHPIRCSTRRSNQTERGRFRAGPWRTRARGGTGCMTLILGGHGRFRRLK